MDDPTEHGVQGGAPDLRAFEFGATADLSAIPSFLRGPGATQDDEPGSTRPVERPDAGRAGETRVPPRPVLPDARDPGVIPMASISPRRLLHVVAVVALAWALISFGRQVATASAASARADELRAANAAMQDQVGAMQRELTLIREQRYVDQQARAYRLGSPAEIPFALQPGASPLAADAPGSASLRLGAPDPAKGPLDTWLRILFGSG
ncbi:MAG: hypothetical protein V4515_02505 [Chloroflexota bacterium]